MTLDLVSRPLGDFTDQHVHLDDLVGPNDVLFVRGEAGFAGIGCVASGSHSEVRDALATMRIDKNLEHEGMRGVALGWHSFDGRHGRALVPRLCFGRAEDGSSWVTFPRHHESEVALALERRPDSRIASASYTVRPGVDVDHYLQAVAGARDAVRRGELSKAVIARDIFIESSEPIDLAALLRRLRGSFGTSYRYSIERFVGASPELLVERRDDVVRSLPLAGTAPRTGDPTNDARLAVSLRNSAKNQVEHRVVIDMVHDTLLPWCSYLDWEPEPAVIAVANVQHLGTRIEGRLSEPLPHVVDLMQALSPTPALGGYPREAALQLIERFEGMDRGRYGGAVGWFDHSGNGTWAVAIRCAEFSDDWRRARLFAGGGIVADSDPQHELAETQAKFQAMLAAIVRT